MRKTQFITFKVILATLLAFSASHIIANPIQDSGALIPKEFGRMPSADLIYQGRAITPDEAYQLATQQNVDLSLLNPSEDTDLWKNVIDPELNSNIDDIGLYSGDEVSNVRLKETSAGIARFIAEKSINGSSKPFQFILARKAHTFILRKALLRKLGYELPPLTHVAQLKLSFRSKIAKEKFILDLSKAALGDANRWIASNDPESKELVLQDLIARKTRHEIIDLSAGILVPSVVVGKRIMRSIIVPYSLVNVGESVNMFSWNNGKVINNQILFPVPNPSINNFYATYNDAKWIGRRILKLTRADFEDIVKEAKYPIEVEKVLIEKLISRRNDLIDLLELDGTPLAFNSDVSYGNRLVKGKLIHREEGWDGYASRFTFGDPDSPLSASELFAYGKSKFYSNLLANSLTKINKLIPKFDVQKAIMEHQYENFLSNIKHFANTGESRSTPLGFWATPTGGAQLIASREIVAGPHMGTDNLVQIADTVGFSVNAGAYIGVDGVSAPWAIAGNATGSYSRRYTHLKPIYSMKKALSEPIKNMMVPWFKKNLARKIDDIIRNENDMNTLIDKITSYHGSENPVSKEDLKLFLELGVNPARAISLLAADGGTGKEIQAAYLDHMVEKEIFEKLASNELEEEKLNGLSIEDFKKIALTQNMSLEEAVAVVEKDERMVEIMIAIDEDKTAQYNKLINEDIDVRKEELEEEKQNSRASLVEGFKDSLSVGESIIITDSIGAHAGFRAAAEFYSPFSVKVLAGINADLIVLNRLHIHRKSKDVIHVYKDDGNKWSLAFSLQIKNTIPILKLSAKYTRGKAQTKYYSLNIDEKQPAEDLIKNLRAIQTVLAHNSLADLNAVKKPFTLRHKFSEKEIGLSLLWMNFKGQRAKDEITVENGEGDKKEFFLMSSTKYNGKNYQDWIIATINELLDEYSLNSSGSSDAGTLKGSSKIRKITVEGELIDQDGRKLPKEGFASMVWQWKGWSIKKRKALKLFKKVNKKFDFVFFPDTFLNDTKAIQLYNLSVNMMIYKDALDHMINIPRDDLLARFEKYAGHDCELYWPGSYEQDTGCDQIKAVLYAQKRLKKAIRKKRWEKIGKRRLDLLKALDVLVEDFNDLVYVFGGEQNIYIYAKLAGFLSGDERGDDRDGHTLHRPFTSQTIGEFGSPNRFGPLQNMQKFLGMTSSEFYAFWIRKQLQ